MRHPASLVDLGTALAAVLTLYLPVVQNNSGAKSAQTCITLPTGAQLGPHMGSTFVNTHDNPCWSVVGFRPPVTPYFAKTWVLYCRREWW
jgi:hypothetical protein